MKTKQEIVENWLPRYTQRPVKDFTKYILLTNFSKYVEIFATHFHVPILGEDSNMPSASADGVTIINFGMGSANAATVMDLLSAVKPEAVLFLGKCGGIKKGKQIRRLYFTDSCHSWGRDIERLLSTRSPGIAGFHVATGSFHSRQESPSRLLDRNGLHD